MIDFGLPLDPLVLGAGLLLVVGALSAALAERIRIPALLLFLAVGMLVGDDGLGWISLDDPETAQTAGIIALLAILFEGGLTIRAQDLRRAAVPGFTLATLGVVVTGGIVAAAVLLLTDLAPVTALLLGAVVSSTDAAAVFTLVRRSPLPRRITSLLEVESGANDPVAVLLTIGVLEAWRADLAWYDLAVFGAVQLGGGALIGALVGVAAVGVLRRASLGAATLYPILALGAAATAYGLTAAIGGSGFLAVYLCGLLVGMYVPAHRRVIRTFHQALAGVAEIGLFLLLGLLVFPSQLPAVTLSALGVTAVVVLLARPIAVHLCLSWQLVTRRWHPRETALVSWAGLRGAVPIVLATFPLTAAYPEGADIFNTVFFVVLIATAVQGPTLAALSRTLGLSERATVWSPVAEFIPVDDPEIDVIEVQIAHDMPVAGRPLREVPPPDGCRVVTLIRHGRTHVPQGYTVLEPDDRIIVIAASHSTNDDRIATWAFEPPDPQENRA